jgi:hypothetical protein
MTFERPLGLQNVMAYMQAKSAGFGFTNGSPGFVLGVLYCRKSGRFLCTSKAHGFVLLDVPPTRSKVLTGRFEVFLLNLSDLGLQCRWEIINF